MKNKKKTEWIILLVSAIVLVIAIVLPVSGKLALVDEFFDVLVLICFASYALFVIFTSDKMKVKTSKSIKILVISICVLFIGWFSKNLILDLYNGPKSITIQNITTSSYQGYTGIFSSHYYVEGYDKNQNIIKIEISKDDYLNLRNKESISVDYFENTGRALSILIER